MKKFIISLVLVFAANTAFSQTTFQFPPNVPLSAEFENPNTVQSGDIFRLYINDKQAGPDVPATAGTVRIGFSNLPVGNYWMYVSIWRGTAEARSGTVTLNIVNPPQPLQNLKVIQVTMQGLNDAGDVLWEHKFLIDALTQ